MRFIARESFLRSAADLPLDIEVALQNALKLLGEDPWHPLLHVKKLNGRLSRFFSFRVSRDWRVIFYIQSREIICLVDVANRKDIYR